MLRRVIERMISALRRYFTETPEDRYLAQATDHADLSKRVRRVTSWR